MTASRCGKKRNTEGTEIGAQRPQNDTPRDFDSEGDTTSVAMERVRKLLKIDGIDGCRCAKECVIS